MTRCSRSAPFLFLPCLFLVACVPARKYEEANRRAQAMQQEVEAADRKALEATTQAAELEARLSEVTKRIDELGRDTTVLGTSLRKMTTQYDKIDALNDELLRKYNDLLVGNNNENRRLLTDLEALRLDVQNKEDSVNALAERVGEKQAALAALQAELEAKNAAMKDLKDRVSAALTGFEGKGLTVTQKGGKIYVNLENKLLFATGSTVVESEGRKALASLAKAIENEKDLSILVEGHTDTDKILPGGTMKDNWDLSVLRATSVVRILQESSKLDPTRITAGGRGEHVPVDPADKAKNRRIEVILSPNLEALYKLVQE